MNLQQFKDSFWAKFGGAIAVLVVGVLAVIWTGVIGMAQAQYRSHIFSIVSLQTAQLQTEQRKQSEQLSQIQRSLKDMEVQFGLAIRWDCCSGDEKPTARVNVMSPAFRWTKGEMLKVTRHGGESESVELEIIGTFTAENRSYLLQLNRVAWEMIGGEAENVGIKIEQGRE